MPIFYNTAAPTPTTKNTINSVTVGYGIRDFLLNLNLLPQYPQLSTSLNGSPKIGEPVLDTVVNTGANVIPNGLPLETEGILWKELIITNNKFKNTDSNANNLKSIDYLQDISNTAFGDAEWPQGVQSYPTFENEDIEKYGIVGKTIKAEYRKKNTIKNLYLDASKQIDMAAFIDLQPGDITQQIKGYLDTYGGLNLGGSGAVQAANVIGSIANGQGLGLAKGGVVTNFDVRSSLAGRVLGATGLINDTKLGLIGGQQLALALANNAAFNVQQELLGKLNVKENVYSLLKGDGLAGFRPNYTITIPEGGLGRALDTTARILGFEIPRSFVTDEGSIFQTESGDVDNITRANSLLLTTGKGQLQALISNVNANQIGISPTGVDNPKFSFFRTGYAPSYILDNKGNERITNGILYAFSLSPGEMLDLFCTSDSSGKGQPTIPILSYDKNIANDGFNSPEEIEFLGFPQGNSTYDEKTVKSSTFSWGTEEAGIVNSGIEQLGEYSDSFALRGSRKSLLVKTQKLFNSNGMKNIVSRKGDMNKKSTQIQTANGGGFSKGNAVLSKQSFNLSTGRVEGSPFNKPPEEVYCRAWTTFSRYDSVNGGPNEDRSGLVRNDALYEGSGEVSVPFRNIVQNSVLEDTGFVKIVPYRTDFDKPKGDITVEAKRYMLSIENLAWFDKRDLLPKGELGPGDLLTGKKGRIMWFPPYDINFSESTSVEWESNKFIGRGEPVYTYNNTERTGQLSFKIIVDHSTYTNTFRGINGPDDHYVASFMAGCIEPSSIWTDRFTSSQSSEIVTKDIRIPQQKVAPPDEVPPPPIDIYFPNDNVIIDLRYENGLSGSTSADTINWEVNPNGEGFGLGEYPSKYTKGAFIKGKGTKKWDDRYNYGLNYNGKDITNISEEKRKIGDFVSKGIYTPGYFDALADYLKTKCKFCKAKVNGYASAQGLGDINETLAKDRAASITDFFAEELSSRGYKNKEEIKKLFSVGKTTELPSGNPKFLVYQGPPDGPTAKFNGKKFKVTTSASGCIVCSTKDISSIDVRKKLCPADQKGCKQDRKATVVWEYDKDAALAAVAQPEDKIEQQREEVTTTIKQKFYNETMFFDKLLKTDQFIFDKFREKIKYFHPAFHSMTPEGLNSRLTFLQQCTRQGPTDAVSTNNLAFGRPPVCILRIGDFYYTKIVIDSLSIDYEPLVWDLNPEGIGVQPMIANVSLSFKYIGGESMYGPINKLQNALSFNYYANAQVYEARADYIAKRAPAPPKPPSTVDSNLPFEPISQKDIDDAGPINITAQRPYYLVNGVPSIDPEITTVSNTLPPVASQQNQEKANEQANSGTANQTQPTTATTKSDSEKFLSPSWIVSNGNNSNCPKPAYFGDFKLSIGYEELTKDYDAKLIVYDKNMKQYELAAFKISKGSGPLSAVLVNGKFNLGYSNANDSSFVFDTSGNIYSYQLQIDIIGLKKIPILGGLNAKNSVC